MASTSATWIPTSLQLRLALHPKTPSPTVLTCRFHHPLPLRLRSTRNGDASIKSDSTVDTTFSGWSGNDDEQSLESQRKKWFGGIVGAGVAGVVLFTGLVFAALSLNKRSSSRVQPQMEPLMTEQEVSLASDLKDDQVEEGSGIEDTNTERETGINKDLSSPSEYNEVSSENKIGSDSEILSVGDVVYASSGTNAIDSASVQEDLPENEAVGGLPIASSVNDSEASLDTRSPEPISEIIEENLVNVEPANLSNTTDLSSDQQEGLPGSDNSNIALDSSTSSSAYAPTEPVAVIISVSSESILEPQILPKDDVETVASPLINDNLEFSEKPQVWGERNSSFPEVHNLNKSESSGTSVSEPTNPLSYEKETYDHNENSRSKSFSESTAPGSSFSPAGIPAPSVVSAALQVLPGKVLVPAVVDQVQGQALAALQILKVIEADAQPGDLCTRREYARWLVSASSALSRNTMSKVYPAMYIENVTELAFDDITPEDPDFSFIQGLAEAGLISSKLSNHDLLNEDTGPFSFSPASPLSRQDLVTWKMALEKRQLPEADRKILYQLSGFIDIDKINPDAWPALVADLSAGEQGITALAFGCTRLFQPDKPVTKAQAAVALATGEASDVVSEELARLEAESAAENAVSAHSALVAEVEKDINASFEKELSMEREKIDAVEKMAEEAKQELERLRAETEGDKLAFMKERASIESEMEILSKLRREVEEQLESLMSNKVEISYEKERINKLKKDAEHENQEIARLQYELEVERKALSMARAWAEDEAKRAREQAKALEEARDRWERHGIKVVVDDDLREESAAGVTWLNASKQYYVEGTVDRAQGLADKLKVMAEDVKGKSGEIINKIIQKILHFISVLKEWASKAGTRAGELKDVTIQKTRESVEGFQQSTAELRSVFKDGAGELKDVTIQKTRESVEGFQQSTAELRSVFKDGAKRVAGDCRDGVEKLTQRFKS